MILSLDFQSDIPIYQQIRNQIVTGISKGELKRGEKLPTTRGLATELGVNTMTVNKAYQLLKQEGYIVTERRNGAMIREQMPETGQLSQVSEEMLKTIISEAKVNGISKEAFLEKCRKIYEYKLTEKE